MYDSLPRLVRSLTDLFLFLSQVVYFFAPGFFYLSIVIAVFTLCQELVIFDREQDDNLYG